MLIISNCTLLKGRFSISIVYVVWFPSLQSFLLYYEQKVVKDNVWSYIGLYHEGHRLNPTRKIKKCPHQLAVYYEVLL